MRSKLDPVCKTTLAALELSSSLNDALLLSRDLSNILAWDPQLDALFLVLHPSLLPDTRWTSSGSQNQPPAPTLRLPSFLSSPLLFLSLFLPSFLSPPPASSLPFFLMECLFRPPAFQQNMSRLCFQVQINDCLSSLLFESLSYHTRATSWHSDFDST